MISPLLNIGLLDPREVVERVVSEYRVRKWPLNSVEGFIAKSSAGGIHSRHLLGHVCPDTARSMDSGPRANCPDFFSTQADEMNCLAQVIGQVKQFAYAHHIQRLMVLGNFFLLAQIAPKDVNRWFIEMFGDGYEWVMLANVFGMILHADGGYMATKPYAASAAYIKKNEQLLRKLPVRPR